MAPVALEPLRRSEILMRHDCLSSRPAGDILPTETKLVSSLAKGNGCRSESPDLAKTNFGSYVKDAGCTADGPRVNGLLSSSSSMRRKSFNLNAEASELGKRGFYGDEGNKGERQEWRKKLKLELEAARSISSKIDLRHGLVTRGPKLAASALWNKVDPNPLPADGGLNAGSHELSVTPSKEGRLKKASVAALPTPKLKSPPGKNTPLSEVFRQCSGMVKKLLGHKFAWIFKKPVDAAKLGLHDYHTIIKRPMDLGTINARLRGSKYSSPQEFHEDVQLVWSNAMTYNPPGSDVHVMAVEMKKVFGDIYGKASQKWRLEEGAGEDQKVIERSDSKAVNRGTGGRKTVEFNRDAGKRELTFEEKQELSVNLGSLEMEKMEKVVQIVSERNPHLSENTDEIELDIESLDIDTLWELHVYVKDCMDECKGTGGGRGGATQVTAADSGSPGSRGASEMSRTPAKEPAGSGRSASPRHTGAPSHSYSHAMNADEEEEEVKQGSEGRTSVMATSSSPNEGNESRPGEEVSKQSTSGPDLLNLPLDSSSFKAYGKYADIIRNAQKKVLSAMDTSDPKKLAEMERKHNEEMLRLEAEARAAQEAEKKRKEEEAAEARRKLEQQREEMRKQLQGMAKAVEFDDSQSIMKDLNMLHARSPMPDRDLATTMSLPPQTALAAVRANVLDNLGLALRDEDSDDDDDEGGYSPAGSGGPVDEDEHEDGEI